MLQIIKKEKPNLPKCHMICDDGLHKKLNNFDLLTHLNQHSTTLLIGRPGSGKTSLIYSLFKSPQCLRKVFHKIHLFQPSSSGNSMKDNIFETLPPEQRHDELDIETLEYVYNEIKSSPKDQNKAIIFDDCSAYLKNKELQKMFKDLAFNRRHHSVSIFFLSQTYFSVPKELRKIFNNLFIFKTSKTELSAIFEEQIELNKDLVIPISKLVYDKPHQFLFINTDTQKIYKNFDEIVINGGDDKIETG